MTAQPVIRTEATHQIVKADPAIGVLMLTMFEDDTNVFAAMQAGARGYLLKGATPTEVAHAIHAVNDGQVVFGAALAARNRALLHQSIPAGITLRRLC